MVNLLRQDLAQAFAITDKAAANNAGGVALWDMPPVYSAAYNPIVITRTQYLFALDGQSASGEGLLTDGTSTLYPDPTPTTAIVTIAETDGTRRATLSAESFNGITTFDVSAVVRLWFNEQLATTVNMPVIDRKLFVRYRIEDADIDGEMQPFMALNAVAQVGESSNMGAYIGKILSRAPRLILYEGYDGDYATLTEDGVSRDTTSKNAVRLLDESGNPILTEDGMEIYVIAAYGTEVARNCVPLSPFYVRWINQLGGVDYWMFEKYQQRTIGVGSTERASTYVANPYTANGNEHTLALTAEDSIRVGAGNLTRGDFEALRQMPFSRLIEWWRPDTQKWVRLNVESYSLQTPNTGRVFSFEVELSLPKRYTQIEIW